MEKENIFDVNGGPLMLINESILLDRRFGKSKVKEQDRMGIGC
ncbi:MAG: hypothetical protein ACFFCS_18085 [Candidatus Hodarchaeota archaeon]